MEVKFKLKPPMMPNFLTYEAPAGKKQDGFNPDGNKIDVGQLTEEQATEYSILMQGAFMDHWRKRSNEVKNGER